MYTATEISLPEPSSRPGGHLRGLSESYLSAISKAVAKMILEKKGYLPEDLMKLSWLREGTLQMYADAIENHDSPVVNYWGFLDATHQFICRPG